MEEIKDFHGTPLQQGDKVIFTKYGNETLRKGTITRITAKTVHIGVGHTWGNARITHNYVSSQVIKHDW